MKKRFLHRIAIGLVGVFLLPILLKTADALFHSHEHTFCTSKTTHHYHKKETDCTIIGLNTSTFLSDFSLTKSIENPVKISFYNNLYVSYQKIHPQQTFLLRAPPILIS